MLGVVRWAEQTLLAGAPGPLSIRAFERDSVRIGVLEGLGYRRGAPEGVWSQVDLGVPIAGREPPAAFRVRDCVAIEPAARAAVHREAWSELAHIGIKGARSNFTPEVYLSLRAAPLYDPALDIVVEGPGGQLVSNCLCWTDPASGIGVVEPVGTTPAWRGRGLAQLAILEGLRRLRERGMTCARVGAVHFNAPAIAAYAACGFEQFDRSFWWTRPA